MSVTFSDLFEMIAVRPALPAAEKHLMALPSVDLNDQKQEIEKIATLQKTIWPQIKHPRIAVFADGASKEISLLSAGQHALNTLAKLCNADLRVYELPQANTALSEQEVAHAVSYGLLTIEENIDALIVGLLVEENFWEKVTQKLQTQENIFQLAAEAGSTAFCALVGALLSARMASVPVICGPASFGPIMSIMAKLTTESEAGSIILKSSASISAPDAIMAAIQLHGLQGILALGPQQKKLHLTQLAAA